MSPGMEGPLFSYFAKEYRFNSLVKCLSNLGIGLSAINRDMRIVWINQVLSDAFGPTETIYGQYCYKVYRRRKKPCPNCPTLKAFRSGEAGFKAIQSAFNKDSKRRYYQLITAPIRHNNEVVEVLEIVQDVTKEVTAKKHRSKLQSQIKRLNQELALANRSLLSKAKNLTRAYKQINRLNTQLQEEIKNKSCELKTAIRELTTVYTFSREITSTLDLREIFAIITRMVCSIMNTQACVLRMLNKDKKELVIVGSHGVSKKYLDNTPLKIGEGLSGTIVKTGQPIICPQVSKEESAKYFYYINQQGYQSALGVPILFNGKVLGSIVTYGALVRKFTKTEVIVLSTFASQVAVAIRNTQLHKKVHLSYLGAVNAMAKAAEARDPYTFGHSERVTGYAIELARDIGLPRSQVRLIQDCGRLHDLGKIAVPDAILRKPGPLTEEERATIQLHPLKAIEMLAPLEFLEEGFPLIKYHHERFDGNGYPQGLKRTDIPVIARVFSCADAFDAMSSDRPYRTRLPLQKAIKELQENAGSQFDPYLARRFVSILKRKNGI